MKINNSGYVLLSQGEYSDYQNTAFRVLKPFTFAETAAAFKAQWTPGTGWKKNPRPDEYVGWLVAQGFVEDADEIQELHVGAYSFNDGPEYMDEGLGEIEFQPRAPRTTQPTDQAGARSIT